MSAAEEAVRASVSGGPDVSISESESSATLPAGQARRKVLPIVEGLTLIVAMLLPLVLQDYLTVFATRASSSLRCSRCRSIWCGDMPAS